MAFSGQVYPSLAYADVVAIKDLALAMNLEGDTVLYIGELRCTKRCLLWVKVSRPDQHDYPLLVNHGQIVRRHGYHADPRLLPSWAVNFI